ncbi:methyl-accepting chemotaxis protein [Aetokthonos hydrillicola]|uniref:methyl-accepting chemotaxis protein n=1 Tax=Aetokthonos hydrillicola TaxID=1550245 RepID=UPI001ABA5053|nr:methyl-accepting chemotaxis protein [Aetokthonos hydrillicola]MBO3458704.1 methyl-accepting chemotaxis protein [Aetokthonos hydrillicola CCALA 1050]
MKNFSLQARLFSGFIFLGLIVLVVAIIGWIGSNSLSQNLDTITNNAFPSIVNLSKMRLAQTAIQSELRVQLSPDYPADLKLQELEKLKANMKLLDARFEDYKKLSRESEEETLYQALLPALQTWQNSINEVIRLIEEFTQLKINDPKPVQIDLPTQNKANTPESTQAKAAGLPRKKISDYLQSTERPAYNKSETALVNLLQYNEKLEEREATNANQNISKTNFWVLVGMTIGPLTAIIFGFYFSNTIAKPMGAKINRVVTVAEQIAQGDLTGLVQPAESNDEIGKLQDAFYKMKKNLNSLILQTNKVGIQITSSTTKIAASGKQLEATLVEQTASTNEVSATSGEIAATSGQLVKTMDNISEKAQATALAANNSQSDLMQMASAMRSLAVATTSIASTLGIMNEKANNINTIVTTITKVADQTNLLSLNAAIEAEKAGEYGAGFAVVAREIRRLADQTAVATLEIEQMVKEMQSSVSAGVMQMDKFNQEVSVAVEKVNTISGQIALVIEQVQSLTPRFEEVGHIMEQQFEGAQQISGAIAQLSEGSQQTLQSLKETNRAVEQLDDAAQGLRSIISQFKVQR